MKKMTIGEFITHINQMTEASGDAAEFLDMSLDSLCVYVNGFDSDPVVISTNEEA